MPDLTDEQLGELQLAAQAVQANSDYELKLKPKTVLALIAEIRRLRSEIEEMKLQERADAEREDYYRGR